MSDIGIVIFCIGKRGRQIKKHLEAYAGDGLLYILDCEAEKLSEYQDMNYLVIAVGDLYKQYGQVYGSGGGIIDFTDEKIKDTVSVSNYKQGDNLDEIIAVLIKTISMSVTENMIGMDVSDVKEIVGVSGDMVKACIIDGESIGEICEEFQMILNRTENLSKVEGALVSLAGTVGMSDINEIIMKINSKNSCVRVQPAVRYTEDGGEIRLVCYMF